MTLVEVMTAAAADGSLDAGRAADGATAWSIGDVVFATLDPGGTVASFRLDPVLAGAARRTPDTRDSALGDAWVEFAPSVVDAHA
jgi:hypothetical protein